MKISNVLMGGVALALVASSASQSPKPETEPKWILDSRAKWQDYLNDNFPAGMKADLIEQKMHGRYLSKIRNPYAATLKYKIFYRIDDISEVVFDFSEEGVSSMTPTVFARKTWIREPTNGWIDLSVVEK